MVWRPMSAELRFLRSHRGAQQGTKRREGELGSVLAMVVTELGDFSAGSAKLKNCSCFGGLWWDCTSAQLSCCSSGLISPGTRPARSSA